MILREAHVRIGFARPAAIALFAIGMPALADDTLPRSAAPTSASTPVPLGARRATPLIPAVCPPPSTLRSAAQLLILPRRTVALSLRAVRGDLSSSGFTGGIQGGYNWQNGSIVYGGEGDFGAFDVGGSASPAGIFPFPFLGTTYALSESMSAKWLATLRARLGYTIAPQLLLYATGGIAFSDFKFASGYSDNAIDPTYPGGTGFGKKSGVAVGWTLGGGGEWLLDGPWSIKAEYLYLDFGSTSIDVATSNTAAYTQTMHVEADLSAQVARVGINFRQ